MKRKPKSKESTLSRKKQNYKQTMKLLHTMIRNNFSVGYLYAVEMGINSIYCKDCHIPKQLCSRCGFSEEEGRGVLKAVRRNSTQRVHGHQYIYAARRKDDTNVKGLFLSNLPPEIMNRLFERQKAVKSVVCKKVSAEQAVQAFEAITPFLWRLRTEKYEKIFIASKEMKNS